MAYKRIMFGTDGSARADEAGRVAAALAKAGNAQLVVVHVVEQAGAVGDVLDAALARAKDRGARRVEGATHAGLPADVLSEVGEARDVGMIVISGGRGQEHALGATAHRLSHRAPCDLLIVGNRPRAGDDVPYRRVMIATDGSATADRAARKAFDLAASIGAEVTMVFVGKRSTGELVTQDTIAMYGEGVPTQVMMREGDPAEQILAAAEEADADLIVVGNKGMSGAKRFFLASVPAKVSEAADRDVLIARTVRQQASELAPGEGGIITQAGEQLAAFMDADGTLHVMSARCTHMGCTVAWNPGTALFECPCHGSKFTPTGEVANGPAVRPLPPA